MSSPYNLSDLVQDPDFDSAISSDIEQLKTQGVNVSPWWFIRVSGRYNGRRSFPGGSPFFGSELDLRIDVDSRHPNSPVMNRVSGDIYRYVPRFENGNISLYREYRESWIMDSPTIERDDSKMIITGPIRYWKVAHSPTESIRIEIPINFRPFPHLGPAQVTIQYQGLSRISTYVCNKVSNAFRDVTLEVDVCNSVNIDPILPTYDTHSHPTRPATLPRRILSTEEAYQEAGISLTISPNRTAIDDSATQFGTWSPRELHDTMETSFDLFGGTWPRWALWCLLAGSFDNSGVGGIMFDTRIEYGGAGRLPERQGCAVFRNHSWFADLVGNPSNDAQDAAMRKFLYTYVHEIGHAFNFLHSWDKGRPDSLSWMNYDWKYDQRNGTNAFWSTFLLRFDDEELLHMRHGDRSSVIMGGDPWSTGSHLENPEVDAYVQQIDEGPIQLRITSKILYEYMEPVQIELEIKNISGSPRVIDTQLQPEYGHLVLYMQDPRRDSVSMYQPIMEMLSTPESKVLQPNETYSVIIDINFGKKGHYFREPGTYRIRAVYYNFGVPIPSEVVAITIAHPTSIKEQRDSLKYYSPVAGMVLYLNGSDSPYLAEGIRDLKQISQEYVESNVGAQISMALAENLSRPFHRVINGKRVKVREAKPGEALGLIDRAFTQLTKDKSNLSDTAYQHTVLRKANILASEGKVKEANGEVSDLKNYLESKRAKKELIDATARYSEALSDHRISDHRKSKHRKSNR